MSEKTEETAPVEREEKCADCRFYSPIVAEGGECRFSPPRVFPVPSFNERGEQVISGTTYFPTVRSNAWCGKFSPSKTH